MHIFTILKNNYWGKITIIENLRWATVAPPDSKTNFHFLLRGSNALMDESQHQSFRKIQTQLFCNQDLIKSWKFN